MEYTLLLALACSIGLIVALRKPAQIFGCVDHPTTRKQHHQPVPLIGGIAMCAAFSLGVVLLPEKPYAYSVLLTCIVPLTLIGLYDDIHHINPVIRLLIHTVIVLLMVFVGKIALSNLGNLFGSHDIELGRLTIPFTVFSVVGVINAFNMMDGLDGLAGGLALIATGWLIVLCLAAPFIYTGDLSALLVLVAVISGFLVFNLRHPWRARASVFMGDAGSTMLGFLMSWFAIRLSQGDTAVMTPMTAVWILALPLMDTVAVMIRRIRAGQSPFKPDRQHLHHLLLDHLSVSDGQVTAILLATATIIGGIGVAAWHLQIPEYLQLYGFLTLFLVYYQITSHQTARLKRSILATNGK